MGDWNWGQIAVVLVVNLIASSVTYGMLKAKVERLITDQGDSELRQDSFEKALADQRIELLKEFVTYETFREFKSEMLAKQNQLDAKLDKVIELLGEIRAGHTL